MKQKCIRCIVQLSLAELHWETAGGTAVHLEGPPIFVRGCVLGQLQHTHLHRPLFPVKLNQQLSFDRILTNCRTPSLFSEVIRGEHVRIELIQVASDYKGGKILARFEAPINSFLFPDEDQTRGRDLREIQLSRSRKYQCPPVLTFTSSTTLLEATVVSPVDTIFHQTAASDSEEGVGLKRRWQSDDGTYESSAGGLPLSALGTNSHGEKTTSRRLFSSTTQLQTREAPFDPQASESLQRHHSAPIGAEGGASTEAKLHSLLDSYTEPSSIHTTFQGRHDRPPLKIKFKPPVPKAILRERSCDAALRYGPQSSEDDDPIPAVVPTSESTPTKPMYSSLSSRVGPHNWHDCPRRQSPKKQQQIVSTVHRSHSAPGSPSSTRSSWGLQDHSSSVSHHYKSATLPNCVPPDDLIRKTTDPAFTPCKALPELRPPFVVRHADPRMLERRDFCGAYGVRATRHFSTEEKALGGERSQARQEDGQPAPPFETGSIVSGKPIVGAATRPSSGPTLSEMYNWYLNGPSHPGGEQQLRTHRRGSKCSSEDHPRHHRSDQTHPKISLPPQPTIPSSSTSIPTSTSPSGLYHHVHPPPPSSSSTRWTPNDVQRQDVVSKYLLAQPGNTRSGVLSPSRLIEEKLHHLKTDCCECKRTAESLGEDDLTEDLDRLRASLAAEREEALDRTARVMPDQSLTVKVGPTDYWSQRMSEFTGRPHRLLFDETMEKIYSKLYQEASQLH